MIFYISKSCLLAIYSWEPKIYWIPNFNLKREKSYLAGVQAVWLSDGLHSIHVMAVADIESSVSEMENKESDERLLQTSG